MLIRGFKTVDTSKIQKPSVVVSTKKTTKSAQTRGSGYCQKGSNLFIINFINSKWFGLLLLVIMAITVIGGGVRVASQVKLNSNKTSNPNKSDNQIMTKVQKLIDNNEYASKFLTNPDIDIVKAYPAKFKLCKVGWEQVVVQFEQCNIDVVSVGEKVIRSRPKAKYDRAFNLQRGLFDLFDEQSSLIEINRWKPNQFFINGIGLDRTINIDQKIFNELIGVGVQVIEPDDKKIIRKIIVSPPFLQSKFNCGKQFRSGALNGNSGYYYPYVFGDNNQIDRQIIQCRKELGDKQYVTSAISSQNLSKFYLESLNKITEAKKTKLVEFFRKELEKTKKQS
ncbi:MAG: hypothetical protein HC932_02270 [Thermales bacterium]|nr:hypothetical protein [Thermales bacterium]